MAGPVISSSLKYRIKPAPDWKFSFWLSFAIVFNNLILEFKCFGILALPNFRRSLKIENVLI